MSVLDYLAPEQWDSTAGTGDDIAISNKIELRGTLGIGFLEEALHHQFGRTVNVDRLARLVGGYPDNAVDAIPGSGPGNIEGANDVDLVAFGNVNLCLRDILEGSGVDNRIVPRHGQLN
jgi:hypothetical protein|tara:strand:- start:9897 stop:10253 length:357 start_codon:yes stop_codon:yes gene_type:complete